MKYGIPREEVQEDVLRCQPVASEAGAEEVEGSSSELRDLPLPLCAVFESDHGQPVAVDQLVDQHGMHTRQLQKGFNVIITIL